MKDREKLMVLIYDRDLEWAEAAKEVLGDYNFIAEIESESFSECYHKAESKPYAALIVNAHELRDPHEDLARFNASYPAIVVVVVEEYFDPELDKLFQSPPVAHIRYGSKKKKLLPDLGRLLTDHIKWRGMLPGDIEINFPPNIEEVLKSFVRTWTGISRMRGKDLPIDVILAELRFVISHMFIDTSREIPIAQRIDVEDFGEEASHSGSSLFKITPVVICEGNQRKSAVLKFGPKDEIKNEANNYDRFVEWFLTVDQTVRKIAYAEANAFAGILYSYPRDVIGGYESFANIVRNEDYKKSVALIKTMFNVDNQHWLSVDGKEHVPTGFSRFQKYYVENVLRTSIDEMQRRHFDKLDREISNYQKKNNMTVWEIKDDTITFPPLNITVSNPMTFLTRPHVERLKITVIHGDLHSYNILIDQNNRYFFIDFFYTGFGHIYRDFMELELSVRYDLFCSSKLSEENRLTSLDSKTITFKGLERLIRLERALIDKTIKGSDSKDPIITDDPQMHKCYEIVKAIRYFAQQNAPDDIRHYYMGLIISSLKALKYFYPLDVKIYRLIIAGMYTDLVKRGAIK